MSGDESETPFDSTAENSDDLYIPRGSSHPPDGSVSPDGTVHIVPTVGTAGGWSVQLLIGDYVVHQKYGIGMFTRVVRKAKVLNREEVRAGGAEGEEERSNDCSSRSLS